jgi:hypothetical protein
MEPMSTLSFWLEHQSPALAAEKFFLVNLCLVGVEVCRAAPRISLDRSMSTRTSGRDASTDSTVQRMSCCFIVFVE